MMIRMIRKMHAVLCLIATTALLFTGCSKASEQVETLRQYPIDDLEGVLTKSGVALDTEISSDGKGSLRVSAQEPRQVPLFETGDIDVENARLIYQARLRTEAVEGKVYLEMWCEGGGKRYRSMDRPEDERNARHHRPPQCEGEPKGAWSRPRAERRN